MNLIFATNNKHKLEEVSAILGPLVRLTTPSENGITEDIPENEPTIEGNALAKAWYIYRRMGMDCFADDTGLEVFSLGGAPGVRSARYAGEDHDFTANTELLLRNLESHADRAARFRTVIALIINGNEYLFEGEIAGVITREPSGGEGFGYDPVFLPDGYTQTFAQMDAGVKNSISHRALAVQKLVAFLRSHENI